MWWNFFKLFTYSFEKSPLERKRSRADELTGAGVGSPDVFDIRGEGWAGGSRGLIPLHSSNEFVDLSSVTNRQSRYKEYERLRNIAEIEMAMTVIADESCVAGHTKVACLFEGPITIRNLAERWKTDQRPFLVYCWDFEADDYTLGWAYDPRVVKKAKTVRIGFDDGSCLIVTEDHRVLMENREWKCAGDLQFGDQVMPFYRLNPNPLLNDLTVARYPRIFTFKDSWKHERQFIDEWKTGERDERYAQLNQACRLVGEGCTLRQTARALRKNYNTVSFWMERDGFTPREVKWLAKKKKYRTVLTVQKWREMEVFDLSVQKHQNFCTDSCIVHNCQRDSFGHVLQINTKNTKIKEELDFLLFNRKMLNLDRKLWGMVKKLCIMGDGFYEIIIDPENPKGGILKLQELPPETVFRIETTKCRLVEFQQSKEGPDYQALTRAEVTKATEPELQQSTAIRFAPKQIIHLRLGEDRKTFYPYGQSLIEPARGPAHQLRLMEDAMIVYRLIRAPERRVYYIDVGTLSPAKAEAFVEQMKDKLRKRKTGAGRGEGANALEERWQPMSMEEDIFVPIRGQSNTRIDTLQGAQNLGEIDDALYFRNKLFAALNFPRNYFNNEDPNQTRITLSAQDVKFARMIERIQGHVVDGITEICERHLELRGFPDEAYEDLKLEMTPPSAWKELSEMEIWNNRANLFSTLKSSMAFADRDLFTRFLHISDQEAEMIESRALIQKLTDLKLQIIGQNPHILGFGTPGQPSGEQELGVESGGPNPMLGQEPEEPPQEPGQDQQDQPEEEPQQPMRQGSPIQEPEEDDIKRYDLEIQNYSSEVDAETIN